MKRFLIVLFFIFLFGGGAAAWWYLQDRPQKIMQDAVQSFAGLQDIDHAKIDIAITNLRTNQTSGFTFVGQFSVADINKPHVMGALRLGARTSTDDDQLVDLVVTSNAVAVRPRQVNPSLHDLAVHFSGSQASSTVFFVLQRDLLLNQYGYGAAIAHGSSADIRALIPFIAPATVPGDEIDVQRLDGEKTSSIRFRFDRAAVKPLLISLVRAWKKGDPNVKEYGWIERTTEGLGRGTFGLMVNHKREPMLLTGEWPIVDEEGKEMYRVRMTLHFAGWNTPLQISIPEPNRDVTNEVFKQQPTTSLLPSSATRTPLGPSSVTPTTPTQSGGRPNMQIDLFQRYSEELKKKNVFDF